VGLILVVVTPLLVFSAFLVLQSAEHEQQLMGAVVRERTQAAAVSIGRQLGSVQSRLSILASSPNFETGDIAGIRAQVLEVGTELDLQVILSDPTGQEIVNTRVAPSVALPMGSDTDAIRRVAATGQPEISDFSRSPLTHEPFVAINVPVLLHAHSVYVLSINIAPALPRMLAELHLPSDWIVTISDREGYTIARSHEADRFVGQMARPFVMERFRAADAGWFPLVSRDGVPVYNAYAHITPSAWVIGVGIPDVLLFAPVHHSTWLVSLVGVTTLSFALLLAAAIGRRLAVPMAALVADSASVGRGDRIQFRDTGVLEADAVANSLHQAGEQLYSRTKLLEQTLQDLRLSEQSQRVLAEDLGRLNLERGQLLQRIVEAQEVERKRIARDLHDSLGQYLTAIRLKIAAIEQHRLANETIQSLIDDLIGLTSDLGREFKRMAWELRPMALDHFGLKEAFTQYVGEWAERADLQIDLEVRLDDRRLPEEVETVLCRVLQEAITNVVKHSGADQVAIILDATETEVRLIVEDNGRGFEAVSEEGIVLGTQHLGLIGVRERLALVQGRLEVETSPGMGTTIYVAIRI
jgi:signal transduction histidine kinase